MLVLCILHQKIEPFEQHVYNPNELYTHLSFISDTLTKNKIKHWIAYGTLLGAVRNNDIIPYDYDFDLGANIDDVDKIEALNSEIEKYGYQFKRPYIGNQWKVSLKIIYNGIEMGDIYLYKKFRDGLMRRYHNGTYFWPKSTFPHWFIKDLTYVKIKNKLFPAPQSPKILLEHWYGTTWKTPIKAKAQGGKGDQNSDYYGGANNMKLNFLTRYLKTKNVFLQPTIDKKINIVIPHDQNEWVEKNEIIIDLL
jgi:hypothetical protein